MNAGYLWINYINATQPFAQVQRFADAPPVPLKEDFNLQGPFASIKWNGHL
ncbi:Lpg1974 family pore-forming outer membrane protein [Legionella nagasakiensis]|uniref:Lpg1974 family pore-forming outer membrane protein n=1 Tax=Legionella nagasakiensis TaxID=535290 RepID=UPI0013EF6B9D